MAASAYFCGSSTQTIRSASSIRRSTSRWWDTSVESWSGRSSRTTPCSAVSSLPRSSSDSRMTWWRGAMSRYSSSSVAPSLPHTQAVAHDVVGRRTPTEVSSTPARALNVDDLPEPVAPARATTVWSAVSPSRVATRWAAASASSTTWSSRRPRAAALACSRPSMRSPRSEPRDTSRLAPSSKDDIFSLCTTPIDGQGLSLVGVVAPGGACHVRPGARSVPGPRGREPTRPPSCAVPTG